VISFTVFGRARPQAQNRTVPLLRKDASGNRVPVLRTTATGARVPVTIHPNPKDTVNWRSDVKSAALAAFDGSGGLLEGPVCMNVDIYVKRPKKLVWKNRPMPPVHCATKPDRSNVLKSLEDALEGVVYVNDSQIADGRARKLYCAGPSYGDVRPRTEVSVEQIAALLSDAKGENDADPLS
jgi:Holliday junction resolvase RusA-like endonuclease